MKTFLVVVVLAALGGVVALFLLGSKSEVSSLSVRSDNAEPLRFEVEVLRPRTARPLLGMLPNRLEERLRDGPELFDHTSPGARTGTVRRDHLELRAKGWHLTLLVNDDGKVTSDSRLAFPFAVGGRRIPLRCRPAEPAVGALQFLSKPDSDVLTGTFQLQLHACENARTGEAVDWPPARPFGLPPAPLTVRGSFQGLRTGPGDRRLPGR